MALSKQEISGVIKEAAGIYAKELLDRNLFVVYGDVENPQSKELLF